eukprot:SAG11_NODE_7509_length_1136_cov_1.124397_1_plen_26_part_01
MGEYRRWAGSVMHGSGTTQGAAHFCS